MSKIISNPNASDPFTVAANLEGLSRGVVDATNAAVYQVGHELLNKAIPLTPMDTGDLRDSGFVGWSKKGGQGEVEVTVGFGGAAAPYALFVHEMTGATFQEAGTGAKYLERPYNEMRGKIARLVAEKVARSLAFNSAPRSPSGK